MSLVVVTPPAAEPVTASEMRRHRRLTDTPNADGVSDADLEVCIKAAREWAEQYTRRAFVTQTLRAVINVPQFSHWAGWAPLVTLYRAPIQSVSSVKLGDDPALAGSDYTFLPDSGEVGIKSTVVWPTESALGYPYWSSVPVTVQYVAGYGNAAAVPAAIRQAVLKLAGTMYEHREDVAFGGGFAEIPRDHAARALLDPYKRVLV